MACEIFKKFTSGFVLNEQDLRRIWNCCDQHFKKTNSTTRHAKIEATLHDASVVETDNIEEILALENGGAKRITRLNLEIADAANDPKTSIEVTFRNGAENPTSWISLALLVRGPQRDWAFLAADEIEERLKRLKCLPYEYLSNHRLLIPILMGAGMLLAFAFAPENAAVAKKLQELEASLASGQSLDPVKVIVQIERAKQARSTLSMVSLFLTAFVAPMAIGYLLSALVPRFFRSYHFCWGEYLSLYEKRRARAKVFWIAGVLGVAASIIASLILKYFKA